MGGGNAEWYRSQLGVEGLSPRGRGKLSAAIISALVYGSIPAWAGETAKQLTRHAAVQVYPRVGGGNGGAGPLQPPRDGLSPRGRGKRWISICTGAWTRSIPAWAGETSSICALAALNAVYPRVGGGNLSLLIWVRVIGGLSPRGRGKHFPTLRRQE